MPPRSHTGNFSRNASIECFRYTYLPAEGDGAMQAMPLLKAARWQLFALASHKAPYWCVNLIWQPQDAARHETSMPPTIFVTRWSKASTTTWRWGFTERLVDASYMSWLAGKREEHAYIFRLLWMKAFIDDYRDAIGVKFCWIYGDACAYRPQLMDAMFWVASDAHTAVA